jgi:hypothetical protein
VEDGTDFIRHGLLERLGNPGKHIAGNMGFPSPDLAFPNLLYEDLLSRRQTIQNAEGDMFPIQTSMFYSPKEFPPGTGRFLIPFLIP